MSASGLGYPVDCPFCAIVFGDAEAEVVHEWQDALAIVPLNPVTPGHVLVIPHEHVRDALERPMLTARMMKFAVDLAPPVCNLITSCGHAATQTVFHLHVHVVPRRSEDGLKLPWSLPDVLVARQPPPDQYPYESMGK